VKAASNLFESTWGIGEKHPVWMSHGDRITKMPPGLRWRRVAECAVRGDQDEKRNITA